MIYTTLDIKTTQIGDNETYSELYLKERLECKSYLLLKSSAIFIITIIIKSLKTNAHTIMSQEYRRLIKNRIRIHCTRASKNPYKNDSLIIETSELGQQQNKTNKYIEATQHKRKETKQSRFIYEQFSFLLWGITHNTIYQTAITNPHQEITKTTHHGRRYQP